jgi:hypothetical protein
MNTPLGLAQNTAFFTQCIYVFRLIRAIKGRYFVNAVNRLMFLMEAQSFASEVQA